ncbi:MAG: SLC13 family permease, partial [Candidatus Calescibacterium sp.]
MRFEKIKGNFGLFAGLALFILILVLPPSETFVEYAKLKLSVSEETQDVLKLAYSMKVVFALLILMIFWWISEAIPIPATALLPCVILPLFHTWGVEDGKIFEISSHHVFSNYAHPVIFLFLAGFLIAGAMQKWGVDKRIALFILTHLSKSASGILLALIISTAIISMWVSNTATTVMMLPVTLGILRKLNIDEKSNYAKAAVLGIAYAASVGGIGTPIGTPPNGIAISILSKEAGYHISFAKWMTFGFPFVIFSAPVLWIALKFIFKFDVKISEEIKELLIRERKNLGRFSKGEKLVIFVFSIVVLLWIINPLIKTIFKGKFALLDEYVIALLGCILLFILPVDLSKREFVLDWRDSKFVDWGTLILFGGGIAISDALFKTGLADAISETILKVIGKLPLIFLIFSVVVFAEILTEVSSNTAVASMFVPILISVCSKSGILPQNVVIPVVVAVSMAFMLPIAT